MKDALREYVQLLLKEKIRGHRGETGGAFRLNVFKAIVTTFQPKRSGVRPDVAKLVDYADATLQFLGAGSARNAYTLTSHKVLKIATNRKGLGQNQAEFEVFTKAPELVAKIYDHDPNFYWLISELVKPFGEDTRPIEKMLGLGQDNIEWETFVATANRGQFDMIEKYGAGHQLKLAQTIHMLTSENGLMSGDLERASSWGTGSDGRLVLLDYGFTEDVADNYYGFG
jgi:hypothetical protein